MNHLILTDKTYQATVRLGAATSTDDAEGTVLSTAPAAGLDRAAIEVAIATLTGQILQRPSSVSAIKVDGERAYALVRAGRPVDLAARPVTIERFEILGEPRPVGGCCEVEVEVDCSSGTYVRALARDLGELLGVGGHLSALRRTRVGVFTLEQALTLEELAALADPIQLPLPQAIASTMPVRRLTPGEASELTFGRTIEPAGIEGTYGGIDEAGEAVALLRESDGRARPVLGFTPAS
jgi:tRNA pseudouridine55 synthase